MRVIAGKARSLKLKTIDSMDTRPTQDRIKETLFNVIQQRVPAGNFLDLFSGSGGIGIEALSRGAKNVFFVENSRKAVKCIEENLRHTHLMDGAKVLCMDVLSAIQQLEGKQQVFDLIYMDAPYNNGFEEVVLRKLDASSICNQNTIVIVESSLETKLSDSMFSNLKITRVKEYKTNKHTFLQKL